MGLKKTTLSLLKGVTFGLVCLWVKSNWDNVTEFEVFFFEGVPKRYILYKIRKHNNPLLTPSSFLSSSLPSDKDRTQAQGDANRMKKIPYSEPSEEVRVQLIELLEVCLESDKF